MKNEAFVYVIESPGANDLLIDRIEGKALTETLNIAGIDSSYSLAINKDSFIKSVEKNLLNAIEYWEKYPILHISAHGDKDGKGIYFSDGVFMSWEELTILLEPLCTAMPGKLIICMSVCYGSKASRMAYVTKKTPFGALVANKQAVNWDDAAVAFITFYHLLFKGMELEKCVTAMKHASGDDNFIVLSGKRLRIAKIAVKLVLEQLKNKS